jgi:hypothetical protein
MQFYDVANIVDRIFIENLAVKSTKQSDCYTMNALVLRSSKVLIP